MRRGVRTRSATIRKILASSVLVLLCASCRLETSYSGNPDGVKVGILGDSITYRSVSALHAVLDPLYRVQIDATTGQRIEGTVGNPAHNVKTYNIEMLQVAAPDVLIVNLGTNQLPEQSIDDMLAAYAALVARFPNSCIIGVTVHDHTDPTKFDIDHAKAAALNAALPSLVNAVADWNAILDPYTNGDVHPSVEGQTALANLYAEAIPNCSPV